MGEEHQTTIGSKDYYLIQNSLVKSLQDANYGLPLGIGEEDHLYNEIISNSMRLEDEGGKYYHEPQPKCKTLADCPLEMYCSTGYCLIKQQLGATCTEHEQCEQDLHCYKSSCLPRCVFASAVLKCPDGYYCTENSICMAFSAREKGEDERIGFRKEHKVFPFIALGMIIIVMLGYIKVCISWWWEGSRRHNKLAKKSNKLESSPMEVRRAIDLSSPPPYSSSKATPISASFITPVTSETLSEFSIASGQSPVYPSIIHPCHLGS